MGILGSISRYVRTCGRLMYADPSGFGVAPVPARRSKKSARTAYLELLEPRVLMTTVFGGEVFSYTDPRGNTVTATLSGNVIAELVSTVSVGNTTQLADISGQYTSGPRSGVIVGNGSVPVNNGNQGTPTPAGAHITVAGTSYGDAGNGAPGNQMNLSTLSINSSGQLFTLNVFDVQPSGSLTISPHDATSKAQDWTIQVIQLDPTSMAGTVRYTVNSDAPLSPLLTLGADPVNNPDTNSTYTYEEVGFRAAAFDPLNDKLYVELHYKLTVVHTDQGGGGGANNSSVTYSDQIYVFDPSSAATGLTPVGSVDTAKTAQGVPREAVTGMTFTRNAAAPTTATLYISEEPIAAVASNPPQVARLLEVNVSAASSFNAATGATTLAITEGGNQLTGLAGLATLPGAIDGAGTGFLFGMVTAGTDSHVTRIDLSSGQGTRWGDTSDLYETGTPDGQSITGLAFNPFLENPFTSTPGVLMGIDTAATNIDFINSKLRASHGDVYAVYVTQADINASITFGGVTAYTGDPGQGGPANSGTVFIGGGGGTRTITQSVGILPTVIQDITNPTMSGVATTTLYGGLDVTRTLQETFGTGNLADNLLGGSFNNVKGLAISPAGQIAVVNTFNFNSTTSGDQLAFVDHTTGTISSTPVTVRLNGANTALNNLEGLAYGDPNLDGTSELYAVYDVSPAGPTLGTLSAAGVFTPISALFPSGRWARVSAISFSPGGTAGDPTHQSLYVVADPQALDPIGTEYLYKINLTFGGAVVTSAVAALAPTYDAAGNLTLPRGIGTVVGTDNHQLRVVSMTYSVAGTPMVFDRISGQLLDINLTTGVAGGNVVSPAGAIDASISGIALDPVTLKFFVVDNLSGSQTSERRGNGESAVLMQLKDFSASLSAPTSLGRFMVDGELSGRVVVPGSMVTLYAGWLNASNVYFAGDVRNVMALTDINSPINAAGKIGQVYAKGNITGAVHAEDKSAVPGLMDLDPLVYVNPADAYSYVLRGSAASVSQNTQQASDNFLELTSGIGQAGSIFSNDVRAIDSFTASFAVDTLTIANGTNYGFDGGFAFVVQNQGLPVVGAGGSGLGYVGILHSAALAFELDPTTFSLSMQLLVNGTAASTPMLLGTLADPASGGTFGIALTYSGDTLAVNFSTSGFSLSQSYALNLADIVDSHAAYVGFTGGSGTAGSNTEITQFVFNGSSPIDGYSQVVRNFVNGGGNVVNGDVSPGAFDNGTIANPQYLDSLRNAAAGQPDVLHLNGSASTGGSRYYAFALMAGQTVDISVLPRAADTGQAGGGAATPLEVDIYNPDQQVIATNLNWFMNDETLGRTLRITADRPGLYYIAVGGAGGAGGNFELRVRGAGNYGITAVAGGGAVSMSGTGITIPDNASADPSIWAASGDIGVIQSAGAISSSVAVSGLKLDSVSGGFVFNGSSSRDVYVPAGNLRAVVGGSIGNAEYKVSGDVGLMAATGGDFQAGFSEAIGGNIQVISASGALLSVVRTNKAIGVVRAASVGTAMTSSQETPNTMLQVDCDRTGTDGTIDLIDVSGNWNGAPIVTGPAGNVRFMRVGGTLTQDPIWETVRDTPSNLGAIIHDPGAVTYTDDSGAVVTLTPSSTITNSTASGTGTASTTNSPGTLTTMGFGVRGAGGVVLLSVISTSGLTVSAAPGGVGRDICDIATVEVQGTGVAIQVVNGVPLIGGSAGTLTTTTTGTNGSFCDVILSASGDAKINAFDIRGTTIDHITNTTNGDINNVNATDVGIISSKGNVGTVTNTTGAALIPLNGNFGGGTFPFDGTQYAGINVANLQQIQAAKSIGNVLATGVVGTLTPDYGGLRDSGSFYGLTGLVVIQGTAAQTSNTTTTVNGVKTTATISKNISVSTVNIGQGIAFEGTTPAPHTGIYANGRIVQVTGTNADIRGNIVSLDSIGTVTLTDGSVINSQIAVYTALNMVQWNSNGSSFTLVTNTTVIDQPQYTIDLVNIQGKGGILASAIEGSSINTITVGANGFGILGSDIQGVDIGTIKSVSAGGYGIEYTLIRDARVGLVSATGSGAPLQVTDFDPRLRMSVTDVIDPTTGTQPNALNDLGMFMLGDGLITGPVRSGFTTGMLLGDTVTGKDSLGNVSAYNIYDSSFTFPVATGAIAVRHNVDDSKFISGKVTSVSVAGDATNMEVSVAGQIGPVTIGGNFMPGNNSDVTSLSQIVAKGANGNITSVVIKGDLGGLLLAEGSIGSVVIGTAGATGKAGTGDLSGTVTVGSNRLTTVALNSLKIWGSVVEGGVIDLAGKIGTIDIGGGVSSTAGNILVNGTVTNLLVGSDPALAGSDLANTLTITGGLSSATITGKLSGALIVQGNVSKFALISDTLTLGTALLTGSVAVGGTLTGATVAGSASGNITAGVLNAVTIAGSLSGNLVGGRTVGSVSIAGDLQSTAMVSCVLGDIKSLTIKGNINGSIAAGNGAITSLSFTGSVGTTGSITAQTLGAITVPGTMSGAITATRTISSIKAGSVAATGTISAGSLASLITTGDMNGVLTAGTAASMAVTVGGNFGGQVNVTAPLSMTVNGTMSAAASITDSISLTALTVKGAMSGHVIVDRLINAIAAGSMNNAVITAGQGLASLKVTGAMVNSLVQAGLSRGADGLFGTNDLNEQGRMGDLGALVVGSMVNSVVAAGGNINTFVATGNMSSSSVSAGLVLQGTAVLDVLNDATPLATAAERNAARANPTLLHGGFTSVSVGLVGTTGANTLVSSFVTAGVNCGTDGDFTTVPTVNDSLTGGRSAIGTFKGVLDAGSRLLANTPAATAIPALTLVNYTVGAGATSILAADPIAGAATATAIPGAPAVVVTPQGTLTITVTGPAGSSVAVYNSTATADRLDTLLIDSPVPTPVTVTVTDSDTTATFGIGRVIATDNTVVGSFVALKGDILGDALGGPSLWIDSDMTAFTVHNLPNDGTWNGRIGGNVTTMTINQLGPGKFRVGGRINTLTVATNVGNPLLQQLGLVTPATAITQIAYNSNTGQVFASDGSRLLNVNVNSGTINSAVTILTLLNNGTVSLSGMAFDAAGNLFGVATLNNQNPVNQIGAITTTGDTLRGMAASANGVMYAIDVQSGVDRLVKIDPTTGAETLAGTDGLIKDNFGNTFSHNITALAIDGNGSLLALTNDRDGSGTTFTTANGYGLGKLFIADNGAIRLADPNATTGGSGYPISLMGATNVMDSMAVAQDGTIYTVENAAGVQHLDSLTFEGPSGYLAASLKTITVDGANTHLVGIGFDEAGNLIGMNRNGTNSELIVMGTGVGSPSARVDAPGLIEQPLAGFAVGKSGSVFTTYAYTTDATTGGTLWASLGVTPTLGTISTTGAFTELLPLARTTTGTPLLGNVTGVAVDSASHIFAITDQGVLAEYSSLDGSLIGGDPIGTVKDVQGNSLHITRIAFDADGQLMGLNANLNNLVQISTASSLQGGVAIALASNVTELGTADAADLTALSFATGLNEVLSYSITSGRFVSLLGTTPGSVGGIVANSFGTVSLPAAFTGHLGATGGGGVVVQGLDALKLVGAGTFTGSVSAVNSIGSVTAAGLNGTGVTFAGVIVSHADINAVTLAGTVGASGVLWADSKFNTFNLTGNFDGFLMGQTGVTVAIKGNVQSNGIIVLTNGLGTLSVTGTDSGFVYLGGVKTVSITGAMAAGSAVEIVGITGAITVSGGIQAGSLLWANGPATTVTVGGTLAGTVAVRNSLSTANLTNVSNAVFAVGQDLTNLNVTGSVSHSILASGVWLGNDGVYNTSDDVIYGGSIVNAKFGGVFTNSLVTAGVLPPQGIFAGANNVPASFVSFDYNAGATVLANIDGAQAGGIGLSVLQNVTFAKPVVSTSPGSGLFSALVAADGIGKVNTAATTANLKKIVRTDPVGPPTLPTASPNVTSAGGLLTFQSGVNGYSGSVDDHLPQNSTISNTDGPILWVDANTSDGQGGQSLVRFEDIIGDAPGQIPAGSTITSATLFLYTGSAESADAPGAGGTLHRMLQTWTNTYNWFSFGGDGIQADNIEAASTTSASIGSANGNVSGTISVDVLADVQAWVNGTPNYGWAILPWPAPGGTNGWAFYSDSYSNPSVHEKLSVTFIPPASTPIPVEPPQPVGTRVSTDEIRLTFNQPIDTSSISASTIQVTDTATGKPITDITFGYFRQTAPDGSTQGVVQVFSASGFGGVASVTLNVVGSLSGPSITGIAGLRSSLLLYPGDPFGVTFRGAQVVVTQ